jgi:hypothetical protein
MNTLGQRINRMLLSIFRHRTTSTFVLISALVANSLIAYVLGDNTLRRKHPLYPISLIINSTHK